MASRFWVGGTGNWDATTTHWSATTGGAGGASVPGSGDDVFFDGNSGAGVVTVSAGSPLIKSLDFTGYTGTIDTTTASQFTLAGTTGANVTMGAGMTVTNCNLGWANNTTGTLTSNGKVLRQVQVGTSTSTGVVTIADTFSCTLDLILNAGTLNTNGQTITARSITSSNSNTRTLTITNSTLNLSGANPWSTPITTGLTINATGSTVNITNSFPNTSYGTITLNDVNYTALSSGTPTGAQSGSLTCRNMTLTPAFTTISRCWFQISNSFFVTGTLTLNGTSALNMVMLTSTTKGSPRTITAAVVSGSYVCFQDLTGAGAATWSGTGWSDLGGNSGITFAAPVTRYWVGDTGNWSQTSHWSTTSGGASGASVPLAQDTAIFDANSFSAITKTVTMDVFNVGSIDYSAVTKTSITWALSINISCYGNVLGNNFQSCGFGTANTLTLAGRGSFTTANWFGISPVPNLTVDCLTGTYTLVGHVCGTSALNAWSGFLQLLSGTLDLSGWNMNFRTFTATGTATRALKFGNGGSITINQQTAGNICWQVTGSGMTITPGTGSAIIFRQATTSGTLAQTFTGGALTYPILRANVAGLLGGIIISDAGNSFEDIEFNDSANARTLTLPASGTTTLRATHALQSFFGTSGKLMSLVSSTPGTAATIDLPSGYGGNSDYASVKDITATTTPWYAGANSTNVSGNTNVIFSTLASAATAVLNLGGSAIASFVASGGLSLGATGALSTPPAAGFLSLSGTAAPTAPAAGSGSIGVNASAGASASPSGSGSVSLSGIASAIARAFGAGSLSLNGSGGARAASSGSGSVSLSSSAAARTPGVAGGALSLAGAALAQAQTAALGVLNLLSSAAVNVASAATATLELLGIGQAARSDPIGIAPDERTTFRLFEGRITVVHAENRTTEVTE